MKKIALLLIITSFSACHEKFEPHKFNGTWLNIDNDGSFSNLPSIIFKNDSAYFSDIYTYTSKAKYQIRNNKITFLFKNDTITQNLKFQRKDSALYIGNHKYNFWEGHYDSIDFINYDLIGIEKPGKISTDSLKRFDGGFHLFKDNSGVTKLKLDEEITPNFNKLLHYDYDIHFDLPITIIYVGKKIKLLDLIESYKYLNLYSKRCAMIITNYNFKTNSYNGFIDTFNFWQEQITPLLKVNKIPKIPFLPEDNKSLFKKIYTPQLITINRKEDFKLLNVLENNNLLISINPNLDLKDYFELKQLIQAIKKDRKIKVRTEFILSS